MDACFFNIANIIYIYIYIYIYIRKYLFFLFLEDIQMILYYSRGVFFKNFEVVIVF
jgi:hypothetical protein